MKDEKIEIELKRLLNESIENYNNTTNKFEKIRWADFKDIIMHIIILNNITF